MAKIAFLFSGQGSQYPGMGYDAAQISDAAKNIYAVADKTLPGISDICFNGSKDELTKTINAQPCIFSTSLAWAAALNEAGVYAEGVAGFSLGEISALTYSGVFTLEVGFDFVSLRAREMQKCADEFGGGMAAVLKLSSKEVEVLCAKYQNIYAVNYNCPGQTVVAGERGELELFIKDVADAGGKAIKLAVSGAFHTPYMKQASENLLLKLTKMDLKAPNIPIYSNMSSKPITGNFAEVISKQVISPVLWQDTIENMIADGFDCFIEVGVKKTLSDFVKRISDKVTSDYVENKESFLRCVKLYGGQKCSAVRRLL